MWVIRFLRTVSLYALIMLSLGLFALSYLNPKLFDNIRFFILDVTAPVLVGFDRVYSKVETVPQTISNMVFVYKNNKALMEQLQDYNQKSIKISLYQQQIRHLQDTLNYTDQFGTPDGVLAKVVSRSGGAYDRTFTLDKGSVDGVFVGQVIIHHGYMAGYIVDVGNTISRAIFVTNINAHIPVMHAETQKRGLVMGDGAMAPKFIYADTVRDFAVGDVLVTSGDGGVFPQGLPVGKISAIHSLNNIRVTPFATRKDIQFMYIIKSIPEIELWTR